MANGCFEKTNKLNVQDYSPEYKLPIYKKTKAPVLYMMLENKNWAKWIISSDEKGLDVMYRRTSVISILS